jgi:hypothetical protein
MECMRSNAIALSLEMVMVEKKRACNFLWLGGWECVRHGHVWMAMYGHSIAYAWVWVKEFVQGMRCFAYFVFRSLRMN